jgi:hypothetical protein
MWDKNADVSKDSNKNQNSKCFVAQTVAPIEKPFSHKRFVATRPSKLDPMLVCFDDFFFQVRSYHARSTNLSWCLHWSYRRCFNYFFCLGRKFTMMFISKLSCLQYRLASVTCLGRRVRSTCRHGMTHFINRTLRVVSVQGCLGVCRVVSYPGRPVGHL